MSDITVTIPSYEGGDIVRPDSPAEFNTNINYLFAYHPDFADQLNLWTPQANALKDEVNESRDITLQSEAETLLLQEAAFESETMANQSADAAELSKTLAQDASSSVLAAAGIDFGSFTVIDGELTVGYYDEEASTPSVVDGEFIITY